MTHACHTTTATVRAWLRKDCIAAARIKARERREPTAADLESPITECMAWVQQDWVQPDEACRGCARLPAEAAAVGEAKGYRPMAGQLREDKP